MLTQRRVVSELRGSDIVTVDPVAVRTYLPVARPIARQLQASLRDRADSSRLAGQVGRVAARLHPFVVAGRWLGTPIEIDDTEKAQRLADLLMHLDHPSRSVLWNELRLRLEVDGHANYKSRVLTSPKDLEDLFATHLVPLVASLRDQGYRADLAPGPGLCAIDANGTLHKGRKGNHRFALARLLGIQEVPLRVAVVERGWSGLDGLPRGPARWVELGRRIQEVGSGYR